MSVPLSVLDLAPVPSGSSPRQALAATAALARRVEALGYHRFWLAEHHGMAGVASSATAVLLAHVAASTSRIRVGSGGVMLPNHAPLVVAEQFATLTALHPGRVDLGIGRAPGTDPTTARALRRSADPLSAEDFPAQLVELLGFLTGDRDADDPLAAVTAVPGVGDAPPVWLLGSSGYSARVAGLLGMPFAFAHHFGGGGTGAALELYRSSFEPSAHLAEPYALVTATVVAAQDDARAEELALPAALGFLRLRAGSPGPLPSPREAREHPWTTAERAAAAAWTAAHVVGGPRTVARRLRELVAATAADELMVTTMVHEPADRLRSFEIVADVLPGRPAGPVRADAAVPAEAPRLRPAQAHAR